MKRAIIALINRVPFIKKLNEQNKELSEQVRKQGAYQAGHYHSPIPSEEDVLEYVKMRKFNSELMGIELNEQNQNELLNDFIRFYKDLPFPEKQSLGRRYYYDNSWYSYSDAIFLYGFLRKYMPMRIIEVGSGFSSAVMLDTIDSCYPQRPEITFIEPHPDRLMNLFGADDKQQVRLIEKRIQDVPSEIFLALESGDLLFIDSSHVVKCGSDLHILMFEILPRLQPGVFVHFHDVFYPFDYPIDWLKAGRYWNENYFLRAFLTNNSEWNIVFFNTYVHYKFRDQIKEKMPLCIKNQGGSLYIQRV